MKYEPQQIEYKKLVEEREPRFICPSCDLPCRTKDVLKQHFQNKHVVKGNYVSEENTNKKDGWSIRKFTNKTIYTKD